ncbi:MAG: cyclodeaminase/cyclohydrolase family protein [Phycisphaeraceae bacterium]|nr:cyclodeaminase/cyclohydrolase family protein [Phycisphaeraceae bacterium]
MSSTPPTNERAIGALSLGDLLEHIASKTPSPGGGAVASVIGALSAALAGMVIGYSRDKKSLAEHRPVLEQEAGRLSHARSMLLRLAHEDAEAYTWVSELQRLPSDDVRASDLPRAIDLAIEAPLASLGLCAEIAHSLEQLVGRSNRMLRSDLAIAAVLAGAAARACLWNVRVNLELLSDASKRTRLHDQAQTLLNTTLARAERVEEACESEAS